MADALTSNINTAAGISQLLNSLFGSSSTKTTSGGSFTDTKQTQLSADAVKAMIQSLMEDPSTGLAKVASGSRVPGMYNTTSQQLMVNDLISRAALQTELARAPTTTTRTTAPETTVTKTKGTASSVLPLLGATMLFSKGKDGKTGWDTISSAMGGAFGGSGGDSGFGASLLAAANDEANNLWMQSLGYPSWYGSPATEAATDFGNDAIGSLISSLTTDSAGGSGIDIASTISDSLGGIGEAIDTGSTYVKDLYDEAADWIGSFF